MTKRRSFLVILYLFILVPANGMASEICRSELTEHFVTEVPNATFEKMAGPDTFGRQRGSNWCWAAATQMILNYHGVFAVQENDVAARFGFLVDLPASKNDILVALMGWRLHRSQILVQTLGYEVPFHAENVMMQLAANRPILAGLMSTDGGIMGHAYVLTAIEWSQDSRLHQVIPHAVILRDPWPLNPSRVRMPWNEFQSKVKFLVGVAIGPI